MGRYLEIDPVTDTLPMTPGRAAYEADLAAIPNHHDGSPRRPWHHLSEVSRWSWERHGGAPRLSARALAQAEWGMYWHVSAMTHPVYAPACAHNQRINALQIMALEAVQ